MRIRLCVRVWDQTRKSFFFLFIYNKWLLADTLLQNEPHWSPLHRTSEHYGVNWFCSLREDLLGNWTHNRYLSHSPIISLREMLLYVFSKSGVGLLLGRSIMTRSSLQKAVVCHDEVGFLLWLGCLGWLMASTWAFSHWDCEQLGEAIWKETRPMSHQNGWIDHLFTDSPLSLFRQSRTEEWKYGLWHDVSIETTSSLLFISGKITLIRRPGFTAEHIDFISNPLLVNHPVIRGALFLCTFAQQEVLESSSHCLLAVCVQTLSRWRREDAEHVNARYRDLWMTRP